MNRAGLRTKERSFTIIEIIIVLVIIGVLAALSFLAYTHFVDKARLSEAVITAGNIREAEITHKVDNGEYVGAGSIAEINNLLSLSINPKNYNYRVVGISDQDFMVLVNKIDTDQIVLAMNKDGLIHQEYGSGSAGSGGSGSGESGSSSSGSGGSSGGGSGSSGGGSEGSGSGGSGGSSGGGSGSGSSGGDEDTVVSSIGASSADLGHTGGGWSKLASEGGSGASIEDGLLAAFNLLKDSTVASYAYDLIEDKGISLMFAVPPVGAETAGAWWDGDGIFVNINQQNSPAPALAALIAHESTHADYDYFPDAWIDLTLQRHSELQRDDISAPSNSFDQEYNAFCNEMQTWIELKGDNVDSFQDDWLAAYNQGEEYMRSAIRTSYIAVGQLLPEY